MLLIAMMTQHKQNEIIIFVSHSHVKGPAADERLGVMRWCSCHQCNQIGRNVATWPTIAYFLAQPILTYQTVSTQS